jgi:hypothetical protein
MARANEVTGIVKKIERRDAEHEFKSDAISWMDLSIFHHSKIEVVPLPFTGRTDLDLLPFFPILSGQKVTYSTDLPHAYAPIDYTLEILSGPAEGSSLKYSVPPKHPVSP